MAKELKGRRFAMVATDRFEQSELTEPREALKRAGAVVDIVRQRPVISKACSTTKKGKRWRSLTWSRRWCRKSMLD
jgi:putative intracellular protease/amidase